MPVIDYKCPNCGSSRMFDSATGMLACPSCGRKDDIEQLPDPINEIPFVPGAVQTTYQCPNCGAELVIEPETSATACSFCASPVVLTERLSGAFAPKTVLPFKINEQQAQEAFRKWCKGGRLTPSGFMSADRVKSMIGMYVPFWLYELHNMVEARGQATRVRTYTQGDYEYTETSYYDIYRKMRLHYVNLPIDASEKLNDELMDKLEPFPYQELKSFKTPYLAGYIAEKYNYDDEQLLPRAKDKTMGYIDAAISSTVSGYTSVTYTERQVDTHVQRADYALLPVWMVNYNFKQKSYLFAMNGQTGKVVGKPPLSKGKIFAWGAGIAATTWIGMRLITWALGGDLL
ncbi:TFIIB-type zinc ribbon-containing protein [Paenibacillus campi]|uniref:TFIIB-type zinc ribbon-containing protein n=1 Tax=Paenibacillus campi TaxID=3106031 RepID=UPI002AFE6A84|nr:TFIIB-type zinc ribbon-containing protein [Paenibacillus sp. SGZ-1014]